MRLLINYNENIASLADAWRVTRFAERIDAITSDVCVLCEKRNHPPNLSLPEHWRCFYSLAHLANVCQNKSVIFIDADQIFIDVNVCISAIELFKCHSPDYLTQWEHCRLPIGCGVRIIKFDYYDPAIDSTINIYIDRLATQVPSLTRYYDPTQYVSYTQSMLDSRLESSMKLIENERENSQVYGLDIYLKLVEQSEIEINKLNQNKNTTQCIDERGLPSIYGFESTSCAVFPSYIMFDLTNQCNATCIHCPHSVGFPGMNTRHHLDIGYFKRVIDECKAFNIDFVRITADGEPLLHPDIWEMLHYARDNEIAPIGLTTNGSGLTKTNIDRLLDCGIFMIDISLDAATEKTYETIRQGLNYKKVIQGINVLLEKKQKLKSKMQVMLSFVKQQENSHEADMFRALWKTRVNKVLIREMITNVGVNEIFVEQPTLRPERWPCAHWFRRIVINYDSQLKACPIDWKNESTDASIAHATIYNAWHSDFYHRNRIEHLNGKFSHSSLCRTCGDWKGTPWNLGYEKVIKSMQSKTALSA